MDIEGILVQFLLNNNNVKFQSKCRYIRIILASQGSATTAKYYTSDQFYS